MMVIGLPTNLITLNLVLFTRMNHLTISYYTFSMLFGWSVLFLLGVVLAMLHSEVKKSYRKLVHLQWMFDNTPMGYKIKVNKMYLINFLLSFQLI